MKWFPPTLKPPDLLNGTSQARALSAEDDAKLVFGTIFSLRNMVRKLGGVDDKYEPPVPRSMQMKLGVGTWGRRNREAMKADLMSDSFISYRTGHYKLHYYETPTSLKFVLVTDTKMNNLRIVLHQIYVGLYVEYVVKNPLVPVEHSRGVGLDCEMFELGLDQFITGTLQVP
ncbi:TRAPP subunit bet5 [Lambiella insularis]|nr:TRAPP subunit bet5 [Lambiella insularis]